MSVKTRHAALLHAVQTAGSARLDDLARQFGVTLQTLRRDVQQLADAGLLTRVHGGVRLPASTTENIGYGQRRQLQAEAKARIARAVAAQVPHHCSLILNIGTTTEAVARELVHHRGLRIVTNNLNVAATLADNADCEVIIAGGVVRSRDHGIVGEATLDFIRAFKVDLALIGISGIEADGSLRDFDWREVKVARAIIEQARQVWLLADHSKFGRAAMVHQARLDEVHRLYTDAPPPEPFPELLQAAGVEVVVASDPAHARAPAVG